MFEVEVKIPADVDELRGDLDASEADPRGAVEQVDTYFDHPVRSFASTDEALRLRRERSVSLQGSRQRDDPDRRATLTYKGARIDAVAKTREELETSVADPDATATILETLGFAPVADVEKRRERYVFRGYTVTLDRVESVGEFVEVERQTTADDIGEHDAGITAVCRALGLDRADHVEASYLELQLADNQ